MTVLLVSIKSISAAYFDIIIDYYTRRHVWKQRYFQIHIHYCFEQLT
jgi:hypothetical protein